MSKRFFENILILTLLLLTAAGCHNNDKFDREKWSYGDGIDYSYRKRIIEDLVKNHHLKGLTYRQAIDSLGRPQNVDTLQLSYQIEDNTSEYNRKKPAHKKNLILYFSKDSVVNRIAIDEHTDKK